MAKSKKKKNHLPKRIAGVKVPKSVRRGRLGEVLASPAGQAVLADVAIGAGALAATKIGRNAKVRRFADQAADRASHAGRDSAHEVAEAGSALTYAIGEAARSFADALNRGAPDDDHSGESAAEGRSRKQSKAREARP